MFPGRLIQPASAAEAAAICCTYGTAEAVPYKTWVDRSSSSHDLVESLQACWNNISLTLPEIDARQV
jgi:hypothetical protein